MKPLLPITSWLPMSTDEAQKRDWDYFDIILISGDAYVDHPSFGAAVIGRILESHGYKVGMIAQPNWRDDLRDFKKLGTPRLFFGVTAGNMDSMVNHYTALKRLRSDDAYTPGGVSGFRPDYATVVYTRNLKKLFPDIPVVIGGIEASMRRTAHYDYWSDSVKPSVLIDSGADLLVYGMAEKTILKVADCLKHPDWKRQLPSIPQIAYVTDRPQRSSDRQNVIVLPGWEEVRDHRKAFAEAFKLIETESNKLDPAILIQPVGKAFVVIEPPEPPASEASLDAIYALPYTRIPHPRYKKRGEIPAYQMIRHSVTMHRGCFGGCSFCTISMHQGKHISSRSEKSILAEVDRITEMEDFKGVISDLGGPSANMYKMQGQKTDLCQKCSRPSCLWPVICPNLSFDHHPLISLYKKVSDHPKVRKAYVGSGVRTDMLVGQSAAIEKRYGLKEYTTRLIRFHVSGRLKVAPEHTNPDVLRLIRKPPFSQYLKFREVFYEINKKHGLRQQLIPYLISSLPGCHIKAMGEMASLIARTGYKPEQVQDFTPTPMTLSSTIYATGMDPYTGNNVYTALTDAEKKNQRLFMFWYKGENRSAITDLLQKNGCRYLVKELYPEKEKTKKIQRKKNK